MPASLCTNSAPVRLVIAVSRYNRAPTAIPGETNRDDRRKAGPTCPAKSKPEQALVVISAGGSYPRISGTK